MRKIDSLEETIFLQQLEIKHLTSETPESKHLDKLLLELAAIIDKTSPQSDEVRQFILKHRHIDKFEDLAMSVILIKKGVFDGKKDGA